MKALELAVYHPRRLMLRRAIFQVHLWTGLLLALYLLVIAGTGTVLVFRTELRAHSLARPSVSRGVPIETLLMRFAETYPGVRVTNLTLPYPAFPAYQIETARGVYLAEAGTTTFSLEPHNWLDTVYDLHVYLLLGRAHGMQVNAIGAGMLLVAAISGLVLWWPGLRVWKRGLTFSLRHRWRRINFDAHSAIGFWTLGIVLWWAVSGVYFGFYRQVAAVVNVVSPIRGMLAPSPVEAPANAHRVALAQILETVQAASPDGKLFSLSDPGLVGTSVYAVIDLKQPGDFSHRDLLTVSAVDGRVLSVWHYGRNETAGDWFLWAMHPLHFGTVWGTPVKLLYALLGLSLVLLTVTGVLMYWNRYLSKVVTR